MDAWAWGDHLAPWLAVRVELPVGALFCVIDGPTRGRPGCGAASRRINSVMRTPSSSPERGCRYQ
jgi:hypothetical protein